MSDKLKSSGFVLSGRTWTKKETDEELHVSNKGGIRHYKDNKCKKVLVKDGTFDTLFKAKCWIIENFT